MYEQEEQRNWYTLKLWHSITQEGSVLSDWFFLSLGKNRLMIIICTIRFSWTLFGIECLWNDSKHTAKLACLLSARIL